MTSNMENGRYTSVDAWFEECLTLSFVGLSPERAQQLRDQAPTAISKLPFYTTNEGWFHLGVVNCIESGQLEGRAAFVALAERKSVTSWTIRGTSWKYNPTDQRMKPEDQDAARLLQQAMETVGAKGGFPTAVSAYAWLCGYVACASVFETGAIGHAASPASSESSPEKRSIKREFHNKLLVPLMLCVAFLSGVVVYQLTTLNHLKQMISVVAAGRHKAEISSRVLRQQDAGASKTGVAATSSKTPSLSDADIKKASITWSGHVSPDQMQGLMKLAKRIDQLSDGSMGMVRVLPPEGHLIPFVVKQMNGKDFIAWYGGGNLFVEGKVVDLSREKDLTKVLSHRYLPHHSALLGLLSPGQVATKSATPPQASTAMASKPAESVASTASDQSALAASDLAGSKAASPAGEALKGDDKKVSLPLIYHWLQKKTASEIPWPGLSGKPLYVAVDPNCIYCKMLESSIKAHLNEFKKAGVQPILIPVGLIEPTSMARAATMLHGGFPSVLKDMNGEDLAQMKSGKDFEAVNLNTAAIYLAVQAAGQQLETPVLIWKKASGKVVVQLGKPTEQGLKAILSQITGHSGG